MMQSKPVPIFAAVCTAIRSNNSHGTPSSSHDTPQQTNIGFRPVMPLYSPDDLKTQYTGDSVYDPKGTHYQNHIQKTRPFQFGSWLCSLNGGNPSPASAKTEQGAGDIQPNDGLKTRRSACPPQAALPALSSALPGCRSLHRRLWAATAVRRVPLERPMRLRSRFSSCNSSWTKDPAWPAH